MLISAPLRWWYFFGILELHLKRYKVVLDSIVPENLYASSYEQVGDYWITNGPMEVNKATAENGCAKVKGSLFSVSENMNLTDLFSRLNLQSTWTGIIPRIDKKGFIDSTDFAPATRTRFETINDTNLDPNNHGDEKGVLLKNVDTAGGYSFAYMPVSGNTLHRAVCLKKIPFPKKKSTIATLQMIKRTLFRQAEESYLSVHSTALMANHSLAILPGLPDGLDVSRMRTTEVYENTLTDDLDQLDTKITEIQTIFSNLESELDVTKIFLKHVSLLETIKRTERKLIDPLYRPMLLVDEKWVADLKPDSWVNIYRQNQDESTIVLQIEQSEGVSGSISTGTNRFRTRIFLPEPSSSTPLPDGTVTSSTQSSTTIPSTVQSTLPDTQPVLNNTFTSTATPTTLLTTTTMTTTTQSTSTTVTALVATEQSWKDWLAEKWQKVKNFAEFLQISLKIPSAYDIGLMIMGTIHSFLLVVLFVLVRRKPKPKIVRKMDFRPSRLFRRNSDGSVKSVTVSPSAPVIPMEMLNLRKPNPTKRVRIIEEPMSDSEDEETPLRSFSPKRNAPQPPMPLYPVPSTSSGTRYFETNPRERRGKLYLPKNIPLYLMQSEVAIDQLN
jgi:hypothetical protein